MSKRIFNFQFSVFNSAKRSGGFTLVEMLIAVSLFIIVVTISMGALLSIFDAHKKTQATKTVVDNLNLSLENMVRTVRFGSNYYCGVSNDTIPPIDTNDCPSSGGTALSVTFDDKRMIYSWGGGVNDPIRKSENGGVTYTDITAPEVKIQDLKFYVRGSSSMDAQQPQVLVVIRGYVGNKPSITSNFSIQTLMSQKDLDI